MFQQLKKLLFSPPPSTKWVNIFSSQEFIIINQMKSLLEYNQIPTTILDKKDSAYTTFGEIELYTIREDVIKAKQIIKEFKT